MSGFYSQSKTTKLCGKKVRPKMQRGDDEWERRFVLIVSPAIIFAAMPPLCRPLPNSRGGGFAMQDISRPPSASCHAYPQCVKGVKSSLV